MSGRARTLRAAQRTLRLMAGKPPEVTREVVDPQAPLRRAPASDAPLDTEALKGERVIIDECTDEGWSHGRLISDGYVGWLPANSLAAPGPSPTHKVAALRTLAFPGPSIKLPPVEALSFGCLLAVARTDGPFAITAAGHYLPARHLVAVDDKESDPVAIAERFLGTPYLWGGKTSFGVDCSGLVQIALTGCGIPCPRDSNVQEDALGAALPPDHGLSNLRRGDLIFWKGHIAMARDVTTIIHANAFHMAVAIEPVIEAVARIRATGNEITCVKRL
jgi:cell wall-associated NlpC family hydrolase